MEEEIDNIDAVIEKYVPEVELKRIKSILYGPTLEMLDLPDSSTYEVKGFKIRADDEQLRETRTVRVAAIQHGICLATDKPIKLQLESIYEKVGEMLDKLGKEMEVNVVGLQEAWTMPFAFCTREKLPWTEFAESAETGRTAQFLMRYAKKYQMVIVSPILERDEADVIWNTAVIISDSGRVIGKHRKNHIPRVGDFNESTYYMEGDTGHPVFQTRYGKIAVNICYGRHHPLNWLAFGLNGAEIVFNPSATVGSLSEPLWPLEARTAAIANSYFTVAINRVGTEEFPREFTSGDGKPAHRSFGHFYGSTYIAAPDGRVTPKLSRVSDGILVADLDLNLCRQTKDRWGFRMTARLPLYAELLSKAARLDFSPQIQYEKESE